MLHITNKTENSHKKTFAMEVFVGLILFSTFSASFAQASDITAEMVIKLTNKARESANVVVLKKNELLTQAAQNKAQDMIDNNYFAHISPQGKSPWNWISGAGYDYHYAGENLAINFTNAEDEQKAWMESELHRKNILSSDYEEIGVAVKKGVIDGQKTIVTVQEFGRKMPEVVASAATIEKTIQKNVTPQQGSEATGTSSSLSSKQSPQKISNKIDFRKFIAENQSILVVWMWLFLLAIVVIIIDVAAVFHKKHRQLLILHDARNRH